MMLFSSSSSSSSMSISSSNADDDVFLPAMIPSWAQAKTEMDLKADAKYAARGGVGNDDDDDENEESTTIREF